MVADEVARLTALARAAAEGQADHLAVVMRAITEAINTPDPDPWTMIGVLIEGVSQIARTSIPAERRRDCALAASQIMAERLRRVGAA